MSDPVVNYAKQFRGKLISDKILSVLTVDWMTANHIYGLINDGSLGWIPLNVVASVCLNLAVRGECEGIAAKDGGGQVFHIYKKREK